MYRYLLPLDQISIFTCFCSVEGKIVRAENEDSHIYYSNGMTLWMSMVEEERDWEESAFLDEK